VVFLGAMLGVVLLGVGGGMMMLLLLLLLWSGQGEEKDRRQADGEEIACRMKVPVCVRVGKGMVSAFVLCCAVSVACRVQCTHGNLRRECERR